MLKNPDNDIVVIGTVYEGIQLFLKDYLTSLEQQNYNKFDVLIANDNLDSIRKYFSGSKLNYKIKDVDGSPASNRRKLISKAVDLGYKKIVFTDCDDILKTNRIEVANQLLDYFDIVVNDLDIINAKGNDIEKFLFSRRYGLSKTISIDDILTGNMMGLSNTAVKTKILKDCPALISGDPIAFDWYFWSSLFLTGYDAFFTTKTSTRYRVYENNLAGLPQLLNEENITRGVEVKRQHYQLMAKQFSRFTKLAGQFQYVSERLPDTDWRNAYISALNNFAVINHIWWENIRPSSEVDLK